MRKPNPLSEILDSVLLKEEPLLDTEWPAGELLLPESPVLEGPYASAAIGPRLRVTP